jgi:2-polyprenyl-3-methyl-5-hydroxy-6-metoxy-1,4-benzoquinol methylase
MNLGEPDRAKLDALVDDPLARWRFVNARREAVIGAIKARRGDEGDYWSARAAAPSAQLRVDPARRFPPLDQLLALVDAETTVLDVGAGWGRFSIPLAGAARAVTAVEPSAALRGLLAENAAAAGIADERLRVVAADWESAAVSPADLVLCANVLMPLAELGSFVRKLDAHTLRRCVIILRATAMDASLADLWQAIHGVPYPRETTHLDALAAIDALGIPAQLDLLPSGSIWSFETPERAAHFARERLWLGPVGLDPHADRLLDTWLADQLQRDGERWSIAAAEPRQALIWWEKA